MKPEASVKVWCVGYKNFAVRSNWNSDDSSKTAIKEFSTRMAKTSVNANRPLNRKLIMNLNDNGVSNDPGSPGFS